MDGRAFLDLAGELVAGATEAHWRGAAIHAYYALMLECRDALFLWAIKPQPHQYIHHFVRLKLVFAKDPDLKAIGIPLDTLVKLRNHASYDLKPGVPFSSDARARLAVQQVTGALALLDAIEADTARRTAAIASLPP
jgi:hypothetical protein